MLENAGISCAEELVRHLANLPIGDIFSGVLATYLRFVTPSEDSHKDRWKTASYWEALIQCSRKIRLFTKVPMDYDAKDLEHYVVRQAGASIRCFLEIFGVDELEKAVKMLEMSSKQRNLVCEYRAFLEKMTSNHA